MNENKKTNGLIDYEALNDLFLTCMLCLVVFLTVRILSPFSTNELCLVSYSSIGIDDKSNHEMK